MENETTIEYIQQTYNTYLTNLPEGCQSIAKAFSDLRIEDGYDLIMSFTEGIEWLQSVRQRIPVDFPELELKEALQQLLYELECQNFMLIISLFSKKIPEIIKKSSLYNIQ